MSGTIDRIKCASSACGVDVEGREAGPPHLLRRSLRKQKQKRGRVPARRLYLPRPNYRAGLSEQTYEERDPVPALRPPSSLRHVPHSPINSTVR